MVKIKDLFRSSGKMYRDFNEQALINAENEKQAVLSARHGEVPDDLKGTIYEDQWKNNPYRDIYYEPGLWDYVNLSNKAKDANFNAEQKYNEYVAGLYDQKRQDEYNSESAKADRMRQAGQNPDLLGLSGASTTDEMNPNHTPPDPALNGQSPAISGFQMMTSVLSSAVSMYQQIGQIKNLNLQNEMSELSLFNGMIPHAKGVISNQFSRFFADDKQFGYAEMPDWSAIADVAQTRYSNKRQQKRFRNAFNHVLSSEWYQVQEDAYKSLDANDRAMKHFVKGFIDLELDALGSGYKANTSDNKYKKLISDWRNDLYTNLYRDFEEDGSILAGLLLVGQSEFLQRVIGSGASIANTLINKFPSFKFGKKEKIKFGKKKK